MHGRLATGNTGIPLLLTSECTEFSNRGGHTRRKTDRQTEGERERLQLGHPLSTYISIPSVLKQTAFPAAPGDICMHRLTCGNVWNTSRAAILLLSRPPRHETRGRTTLRRHSYDTIILTLLTSRPAARWHTFTSSAARIPTSSLQSLLCLPRNWMTSHQYPLPHQHVIKNCKKGTRYKHGPVYYKTGKQKPKIQHR